MSQDKYIVFFYKERKIQGLTTNDDFFQDIDEKQIKYMGFNNYDKLHNFLINLVGDQDHDYFTKLWYATHKLIRANEMGYAYVNWDRYFNLSKKEYVDLTFKAEDIIDKRIPKIKEELERLIKSVNENKTR